ncbi:22629_t:CDS:1, partial [Racocetra persica]
AKVNLYPLSPPNRYILKGNCNYILSHFSKNSSAASIPKINPSPRILEKNNKLTTLPSGRRAHEIPDAIT